MSLEGIPIEEIGESHLRSLIDNEVPEGLRLEYKREVTLNTDGEKKEFLRDVSSFANTAGGDLLIGIAAPEGIASDLCGVEVENPDAEISRIEEIVRHGLEPKLAGVRTTVVRLANSRCVIIIRIPQSWAAPHRVAFKSRGQFYARRSNGKYELEINELRAAFALSDTVAERIRDFRAERISRIVANGGPVQLEGSPLLILHLVPFNAFRPGTRVNVVPFSRDHQNLASVYQRRGYLRYNLDGLVSVHEPSSGLPRAYCQVFRNGIIESVDACFARNGLLPYREFEDSLFEAFPRYLGVQRKLGAEPPLFAMLTLVGVRGYRIEHHRGWGMDPGPAPVDRDDLFIPEIVLEDFETHVHAKIVEMIDMVWNAAGWPASAHRIDREEAQGRGLPPP